MSTLQDQVEATFKQFSAAWKTNDGTAVGNCFAEDGTLINPFGQKAEGRAAVAAMYTDFFGGMLNGTSTSITLQSVRAIGESHAFADTEQSINAPGGEVVLAGHFATLLRRDGGDGWLVVDGRPYTYAAPPA